MGSEYLAEHCHVYFLHRYLAEPAVTEENEKLAEAPPVTGGAQEGKRTQRSERRPWGTNPARRQSEEPERAEGRPVDRARATAAPLPDYMLSDDLEIDGRKLGSVGTRSCSRGVLRDANAPEDPKRGAFPMRVPSR